jgi:YjbE family integral membrane protein
MLESVGGAGPWLALAEIIFINILLSGDNAVVIALAARQLPPRQQKAAILFGSIGAIVLRVVLTFVAALLLGVPYLKLAGAALLLWIGAQMLAQDDGGDGGTELATHTHLWGAIRTIVVADLVMSLDNALGVAAAAKGDYLLLVAGLVISIPLIVYGSTLVLALMRRFPVLVTLGAALLGWVAGEMAVDDQLLAAWVEHRAAWLQYAVPALCAALVVLLGRWLARRHAARASVETFELPDKPGAPEHR